MIKRMLATFLRMLVGCLMLLALPGAVGAQERTPTTPDLIVTLQDEGGAPLAGLTVQLRASADTPLLAQAITSAQGQAVFANFTVSQVRVRVLGTLASGAQVYQLGADAQGIAVFLGPPPTRLALRVNADGMVLPDPVTMIDPVPYGPPIATPAPGPDRDGRIVFPTSATEAAPVGPTVAAATTPSLMTSTFPMSPAPMAPSVETGAHSAAPASACLRWWGVGIGGAVVVVVSGFILIRSLGRRHT
jgi:hypothetical protein